MINEQPFDTNCFFSGGAGMFIQYQDVVKPIYLYAIIQMILTRQSYGLPLNIIQNMSIVSIMEWYVNRRYINPLKQLDINNIIDIDSLDALMHHILEEDDSIFKICPVLNIGRMLEAYRSQHMSFPIYIYSEHENKNIVTDCNRIFDGIEHRCFFGDLEKSISSCDQNFTYIFSDIEIIKKAVDILTGTCSHVLLTRDWRYNYNGYRKSLKYDLKQLADTHPFIRIGTTVAMNMKEIVASYAQLLIQEDE